MVWGCQKGRYNHKERVLKLVKGGCLKTEIQDVLVGWIRKMSGKVYIYVLNR